MHVAALHNGNECCGLLWGQRLFANRRLRTGFFLDVHDGETWIVHAAEAGITDPGHNRFVHNQIIQVIRYAMEFLRADHKIEMRNFPQQFRAAGLRHAAKKSEDSFRAVLADAAEHSHFAQRLLLRHVAHTAGVEQNNIGLDLGIDALIATRDERIRDLLGIAFVHLTAVGLDEKFRHGSRTIHRAGECAITSTSSCLQRPVRF